MSERRPRPAEAPVVTHTLPPGPPRRRTLEFLPLRPHLSGLVAAPVWLVSFGVWYYLARPHLGVVVLVWFCVLAVAGVFIPGVANQVTLARAYLAGVAFAYVLSPAGLAGLAITVGLGAVSDLCDGYVARRLHEVSGFGGGLDPVVDGIFFGAAALGLAVGGAYPFWLAIVVGVRYAAPAVVGAAFLLLGFHPALRHSPLGQLSTATIAVLFALVALLRGIGVDTTWPVLAAQVLIPLTALGAWGNLAWTNWHVLRREAQWSRRRR
ncbi:MAG: CDP-alcohol phosphatidyltransferase family protein [Candidatus Dormibacteraeota bacterium]|nr:CDP-alcohol phosphatidyltransferase family protein [Candidatus Dormibacteraeota bacterium]